MVVSFELKGSYTEADLYDMTIFTHMLIDTLGSTSLKATYKKETNKNYNNSISDFNYGNKEIGKK